MRIFVFLIGSLAFAQATPGDTPALKALLEEVHQLRVDLQSTAVTMQRVQIVLYRLQSQTAMITRAASKLEGARGQLTYNQSEKRNVMVRLQQMEDGLRNTQNPVERKNLEDASPQMKARMESLAAEEQRLQS